MRASLPILTFDSSSRDMANSQAPQRLTATVVHVRPHSASIPGMVQIRVTVSRTDCRPLERQEAKGAKGAKRRPVQELSPTIFLAILASLATWRLLPTQGPSPNYDDY